jgi:hypothetical protein
MTWPTRCGKSGSEEKSRWARADTQVAMAGFNLRSQTTGRNQSELVMATISSVGSGVARVSRSNSKTAYRYRCHETSTMPLPRLDGPRVSTIASEGREDITPHLSVSDGQSRIATSGELMAYRCITKNCGYVSILTAISRPRNGTV